MNDKNITIQTKSMARIMIGPWKGYLLEILDICQNEPPAWIIKLPNGGEGMYFRDEFRVEQAPVLQVVEEK